MYIKTVFVRSWTLEFLINSNLIFTCDLIESHESWLLSYRLTCEIGQPFQEDFCELLHVPPPAYLAAIFRDLCETLTSCQGNERPPEHPVCSINRSDCVLGAFLGADGKGDRGVACCFSA